MSESFYGGKSGTGFIIRPNSLNDGIWEAVGLKTDGDNLNTLYSGVKRGDLKYGEYALITINTEEACLLYRISETGDPIYISEFVSLQGPPGRAGKWFTGTEMIEAMTYYTTIEGSANGDRYLNNENGNVWCLTNDAWVYECNIKGPDGDFDSVIVRYGLPAAYEAGGPQQAPIYQWSEFNIETIAEVNFGSIQIIENGPDTVGDAANTGTCVNAAIYDCTGVQANEVSIYSGGRLPPLINIPPTVSVFQNGQKISTGLYVVLDNKLIRIAEHKDPNPDRPYVGFEFYAQSNTWITSHIVNGKEYGYSGELHICQASSNTNGLNSPAVSSLGKADILTFYNGSGEQRGSISNTSANIPVIFESPWELAKSIIANAQSSLMVLT